jgi:hypothetical protein
LKTNTSDVDFFLRPLLPIKKLKEEQSDEILIMFAKNNNLTTTTK